MKPGPAFVLISLIILRLLSVVIFFTIFAMLIILASDTLPPNYIKHIYKFGTSLSHFFFALGITIECLNLVLKSHANNHKNRV